MSALVFQYCLNATPAGVQNGFSHGGFDHSQGFYVTHKDSSTSIHQRARKFVDVVLTAIRYFGVYRLNTESL